MVKTIYNADKIVSVHYIKPEVANNFTYDEIFVHEQYEKFVKIKENDLVLDLGCSKGYFYFKNNSFVNQLLMLLF